MSREAVLEFLGQVPLLQKLPSSSIKEIAELVQLKNYSSGEYIIRKGETIHGLYIIWNGQAGVSESANTEEENCLEFQLKQNDYFAYDGSSRQVNVIALSKLTCLFLPYGRKNLLKPKSIWNAEGTPKDCSLMEHILHLEPLEVDVFHGFTVPGAPTFERVFGGQLIGQALAAVAKTVDFLKLVHSLHAFFVMSGDINAPVLYQVHRLRDGSSYATRRVEAKQHGVVIFTLLASFQKEEVGFEHQEVLMPNVPSPETLLPVEQLLVKRLADPNLSMRFRENFARLKFLPWPIDIRCCDSGNPPKMPRARFNVWFRGRGKLSDDQALHRCVVAYASDLIFAAINQKKDVNISSFSLDHSMWFHRPVKADDWMLYSIEIPTAFGGREYIMGQMFNQKGQLLVSLTQEALTRKAKLQKQTPTPKL